MFFGVCRLGKLSHFAGVSHALLCMLWPMEGVDYPVEIVCQQLRIVKASGHSHRLLGVDQRLLLFASDP